MESTDHEVEVEDFNELFNDIAVGECACPIYCREIFLQKTLLDGWLAMYFCMYIQYNIQ